MTRPQLQAPELADRLNGSNYITARGATWNRLQLYVWELLFVVYLTQQKKYPRNYVSKPIPFTRHILNHAQSFLQMTGVACPSISLEMRGRINFFLPRNWNGQV